MKKTVIKALSLVLSVLMMASCIVFTASAEANDFFVAYPENNEGLPTSVNSFYKLVDSVSYYYIFIPEAFAGDTLYVTPGYTPKTVTGSAVYNTETGLIEVDMTVEGEIKFKADYKNVVVQRGSLPCVSIDVDEGYSINTIHNDNEAKIKAHVVVGGTEEGKYDIASTQIEMKTRGYTTFTYPKKAYQIKFEKKTDMFGMGKAKKWVLLANYLDGSAVRNKIVFDAAERIGCPYTCKSVFVDLYVNGEYRGVYQLIEKVEIGSTRVDLSDDYGVLLELDCNPRLDPAVDIFFTTKTTGKAVVYKDYNTDFEELADPEVQAKVAEVRESVESRINAFEAALYDPETTWDELSAMIDVESFLQFYFITEFSEEVDATFASTYLYMDGPDDIIHCGPMWDYDRCFGNDRDYGWTDSDFMKNMVMNTDDYRVDWYRNLFRYPEFVEEANSFYDAKCREGFDSEKVNADIDSYIETLSPSLYMNYTMWPLFHTISKEVPSTFTFDTRINYTTGKMKTWITNRKAFLDKSYGTEVPVLTYSVCETQANGWGAPMTGGVISSSYQVNGFKAALSDVGVDGSLLYAFWSRGTEYSAVADGEALQAENFSRPFTAFAMDLSGNLAKYYDIEYRVYNGSWSSWKKNAELVGSTTGTSPIRNIEARIVQKNALEYSSVIFNLDGEVYESVSGIRGNTLKEMPTSPRRLGYELDGWYYNSLFVAKAEAVVFGSGDLELYGRMAQVPGIAGDVDDDGEITIKDTKLLKRYVLGAVDETEICMHRADLDGDEDVTIKDTKKLKRMILEG